MGLLQSLKEKTYLFGFNWVLDKIDVDYLAEKMEEWGEKNFGRGKEDWLRHSYYKILELASAINRRLRK